MEEQQNKPSWFQPVIPIEAVGTKIYLYLKHKNGLHRVMNVQRTGTGLITGSYCFHGPVRPLSHTVKNIHFTYPPDGDYHQTVIFNDGSELKTFYNLASRRLKNGPWQSIQLDEIDQAFQPRQRYQTPSIDEFSQNPELSHHFAAVGFDVSIFKNVKENSLKKPALIVDISERIPVILTCNLLMMAKKWDFTVFDKRSRLLGRFKDESKPPYIYVFLEETGLEPLTDRNPI